MEARAKRGSGGEDLVAAVNAATREADWSTSRASERGDYQRDRGDLERPRLTQLGEVKAADWCTCVVQDCEQSGAAAHRGPTQTSQVREADWETAQARDYKD